MLVNLPRNSSDKIERTSNTSYTGTAPMPRLWYHMLVVEASLGANSWKTGALNAWLGLCFIASSSCGADLLSSRGGGAGGPWLITRTDRLAHLWPLRQRRRLCLSPPRQHSDSAEGVDQARPQFHLPPPQTPLPTTATEGAQVMTASSSTEQRIHPTGHDFSESHVALDVEALQLSAISLGSSEAAASAAVSDLVTVKTAANTSSLYSPSTHALNSSLEHLPRPVRWLVSSKGRMTTVALRALNALRKQRNNGADSWKRALSVSSSMNNGSDGAITQSISSPDWFQHHPLDSVIKSKTRSTSPSHCSSASATQRSLSDTFVFRGLILPVDVSTLGRNCFCDSPQRQETPTVEPQLNVVSGYDSYDTITGFLAEVDTEAGSWHCDVLEAIENLMNCVLIGRVDSSLVELYTKAVMRRSEGSPSHIGACLHSEVAQLLSNYSYSRLARTIAQSFLSEFPPFVEVSPETVMV
ncbi:unnamed protein product [Mesocestoides corti]|uniref:PUM-HD domain-containing protein n=1 Tax=Mesocestoides corti TaxID=53468 RepID=A0A0R3UFV1_MESCO|nr:unnamed protein product [Mesocestoides corti]